MLERSFLASSIFINREANMQIKKVNGNYVVSEGRMNSRNPVIRIIALTTSAVLTGIYIQFF